MTRPRRVARVGSAWIQSYTVKDGSIRYRVRFRLGGARRPSCTAAHSRRGARRATAATGSPASWPGAASPTSARSSTR
jgi:hypothetical protein